MAFHGNEDGVIVISIDFGTTRNPSDVAPRLVTLWPASDNGEADTDCPKVPSRIVYSPGGETTWGQQASDEQGTAILWFKLLLLNELDLPSHLEDTSHLNQARQRVERTGKNVVTIISDYLSKVWVHVLEVMTRERGRQFVNNHPFHVVVTVPAIWQDYAVHTMKRALDKAGIINKRPGRPDTTHAFVSEPEAAALAAIHGHGKYDALERGQTFVVADLGGGTVDLFSFKVKNARPQLVLEEIVEGEGGLCGATFLDQAFLKCLKEKVQQKKSTDVRLKSWEQMDELEQKRILNNVWEKGIKRKYYAGLPGQRIDLGIQGNRRPDIMLEPGDLDRIFDSVFGDISELIGKQVQAIANKDGKVPDFIVLTGGFGRCEYVYRKLRQQYEDCIEILLEANNKSWAAVARGAVLWGAANVNDQAQVQSHVSRYSYGWAKVEDFNPRNHHPEDQDTDELTGRCVARDQMEWIVLRGESIKTRRPLVYEYERYFEVDEVGFVSFSEPIYRSNLRNPPKRMVENEEKEQVLNRRDAEFQQLAIIDMKTPVPVEQLPRRGGTGFPHRLLVYRVEVNVSGACLVIKATSQGKDIGEKAISGLSD
ncbi:hypothetical protein FHL15_002958 [Xylaria flabelliformis]|uniref:Uncharacterized protein n=1 Tax=Xylaria flabelliformis TaxID=2512241 RepID=A0A553I7T1_9PEZI|nr:hypothetical protein FHL15_002958 [Xylaria flabelliformis]